MLKIINDTTVRMTAKNGWAIEYQTTTSEDLVRVRVITPQERLHPVVGLVDPEYLSFVPMEAIMPFAPLMELAGRIATLYTPAKCAA